MTKYLVNTEYTETIEKIKNESFAKQMNELAAR